MVLKRDLTKHTHDGHDDTTNTARRALRIYPVSKNYEVCTRRRRRRRRISARFFDLLTRACAYADITKNVPYGPRNDRIANTRGRVVHSLSGGPCGISIRTRGLLWILTDQRRTRMGAETWRRNGDPDSHGLHVYETRLTADTMTMTPNVTTRDTTN